MKSENSPASFPKAWLWFADDFLPGWVKRSFSPKESWKSKPFTQDDAKFFIRGIRELSDLFTEERATNKMPGYFNHPRFRSSYFLYFVPLHAGKFCTLFSQHPEAITAALAAAKKRDELTVIDLGAGPGTASIALLLNLLDRAKTGELPAKVTFHWIDQNEGILRDGRSLAMEIIEHFAELRGRVTIEIHRSHWKDWAKRWNSPAQLLLVGNMLNESQGVAADFYPILRQLEGGGALFLEPAMRHVSQGLTRMRNEFFADNVLPSESTSVWGPCPHAEKCPLSEGRDWCHFSVHLKTPGKWFEFFSKGLGSAREWQKYSYVWFATRDYPAPAWNPDFRLVISDPLVKANDAKTKQVLLCEPERPGRYDLRGAQQLWRGDLIDISKTIIEVRTPVRAVTRGAAPLTDSNRPAPRIAQTRSQADAQAKLRAKAKPGTVPLQKPAAAPKSATTMTAAPKSASAAFRKVRTVAVTKKKKR